MPRVLWKGAISFGLVNIPVGLYPAEKKKELSFSMLDKRNLSPVAAGGAHKTNGAGERHRRHASASR
jgi:DNA end-binding protein Ku